MIAIELTAAVDAAGTLETFYFATGKLVTLATDTPAHTAFDVGVNDPGSIGVSAFGDGRTGGGSRLELGEIKLANLDGRLDGWLAYSFDGRPVIIRKGDPGGAYPDDFPAIFAGTVETLTVSRGEVVNRLRDRQLIFDRSVLTTRYAGTNSLPNGLEGTADDIMGQPKPRLYGKVLNISPPLINTTKLTYQISDGAIASIQGVYDRGASITAGTAHANSTALQGATVGAGTYDYCLSAGLIRLGSAPAGEITVDATQGATSADRTAAQIAKALALAAGVSSGDISAGDVSALDTANAAVIGLWLSAEETFAEAMDMVINSIGGWYAFDATGVLRMGRLEAPSGTPVITLGDEDILGTFERRPARDGDIPCWSYTVRHSRVWTVQESDLAGSVSAARRAILANEYRAEVATDAAIKTQYLLASEEVDDTLLTDASAAATEAARLLALHKVRRDFFDVTVPAQILTEAGLELMDVLEIENARFGLSSGRLFRLLGINYELGSDRATLTCWG